MLAQERPCGDRWPADCRCEWDTESIYESLTEAFGNNLSLDKQSKDDTKEEERNINIKQDQLDLLWQLEEFRKKHEHQAEPSDWADPDV